MRLAALLLLLANVAFLAWAKYAPEPGTVESQLVEQQIRPESIRLLSQQQLAVLAARKPEPAKSVTCSEWGAFNAADLARAHSALDPLATAARVSERHVEEAAGWWVFMPPQATRLGATQKVTELKRLGIDEYFIVQDDPKLRFAISLGVYRSEEAAKARLEQLRGRGVRTAAVGPRQTPVQKIYLQVRDLPEGLQPKLGELRDAFPGTEMRECPS